MTNDMGNNNCPIQNLQVMTSESVNNQSPELNDSTIDEGRSCLIIFTLNLQ